MKGPRGGGGRQDGRDGREERNARNNALHCNFDFIKKWRWRNGNGERVVEATEGFRAGNWVEGRRKREQGEGERWLG